MKLIRLFYLEGDASGIEEWFEKHGSNITNNLRTEALQWAVETGEWKPWKKIKMFANSIILFSGHEKILKLIINNDGTKANLKNLLHIATVYGEVSLFAWKKFLE